METWEKENGTNPVPENYDPLNEIGEALHDMIALADQGTEYPEDRERVLECLHQIAATGRKLLSLIEREEPGEKQAAEQPAEVPEEQPEDPGDIDSMDLTGYRGLLVEDNNLDAEIATEILSMTGLEVDWARDGEEAVDIMRTSRGKYDLVLMDLQMPRMNGFDAAREIRKLPEKHDRELPIVGLSGSGFADDAQNALAAGMNEYIPKPLSAEALGRVLKRWLPER